MTDSPAVNESVNSGEGIESDRNALTDDLAARLKAAETLCLLYGWSPSRVTSDAATPREKAAHEAWVAWYDAWGREVEDERAEAVDAAVPEMAARRDRIRATTLGGSRRKPSVAP